MGDGRPLSDSREEEHAQAGDASQDRLRREALDHLLTGKALEAGVSRELKTFDSPYEHAAAARLCLEKLQVLSSAPAAEKVAVPDGQGGEVEKTVAELRVEYLRQAQQEFEGAVAAADSIDRPKAAAILSAVDQALIGKQQELRLLGRSGDIFASQGAPQPPGHGTVRGAGLGIENLTIEELQLLRWQLQCAMRSPSEVRLEFAEFLRDQGDFQKASRLIEDAGSRDGAQEVVLSRAGLVDDVFQGVRRGELFGDADPLRDLWLANGAYLRGDKAEVDRLYNQALAKADSLNAQELRSRLETCQNELKTGIATPERKAVLESDQRIFLELLHAPARCRMEQAAFLMVDRRFGQAYEQLKAVARMDPDLVAESSDLFMTMLSLARTDGRRESVFSYHNHLVNFQSYLGPRNFNPEKAEAELKAAREALATVDMETVKTVQRAQSEKQARLEQQFASESDATRKAALAQEIAQVKTSVEGMDLLVHAPAYVTVLEGVYELANRRFDRALEIFASVEAADPEYARRSTTQLEELKAFARQPETIPKEQSFWKGLAKDLLCDAVAIAAGAATVVVTGWSGPGAVAAGGLVGSAAYTGMQGLLGQEIHWYTPVWGAVDGLSGGAGALARRGAMNALSRGTASSLARDALAKTGVDAAALEGLSGARYVIAAEELSRQGLKEMSKRLPMWARITTRLPVMAFGDVEYGIASAALRRLSARTARNAFMSDVAAGLTMSAIYRGGHDGYRLFSGEYQTTDQFAMAYAGHIAGDTALVALGGLAGRSLGGLYRPLATQGLPEPILLGLPAYIERQQARIRLVEIDRVMAELQAPGNPSDWYITIPGPKVVTGKRR